MNSDQTFKVAPFSITAWIWTVAFLLGLVYFIYRTASWLQAGLWPEPADVVFTLLIFVVVLYSFLRSVRSYTVTEENLLITRAGPGRITIPLTNIKAAKADPNIGAFFNVSILSTGGIFGWAGKARVRNPTDLKSIEAEVYGTNPKFAVMLELESGRKLLLTPVDASGLASALQAAGASNHIADNRPRVNPALTNRDRGDKPKPWLQGNKK